MASISITVPDAIVPAIRLAARDTFPDYNLLGDAAAFKAITADFWKNVLRDYERRVKIQEANAAALTDSTGIV